jgi:multimeric flavodoxin WrbA
MACNQCVKNKNEKCIYDDDLVNESIQKMKEADGLLIGTPVHFSAIAGTMKCFLDRTFYVASANGKLFRNKVGASVSAVRRSGGLPAFKQLNNYLNYTEMILPTSSYWNVIHGTKPGDAKEDLEGVQIMQTLGDNMLWCLKLRESGDENERPVSQKKVYTNFIR